MLKHNPILIIGMARSGTSVVSHIIGSLPNVHIEVEPHALWRSGNFKYFNDEEYDINDSVVNNIRNKLTSGLGTQWLVEKSPINSLRPKMVHAVFPDAKIIYMERDPVRCIFSNYSRSIKKDSFKLSIILKKYFIYTGSKDLSGAISEKKLFQQISVKDLPQFMRYTARMFYLRQVSGTLPFGPKIKDFEKIVKAKGMLAYHVEVYKRAQLYKEMYKQLYGDKMQVFKMEEIMNDKTAITNMIEFTGIPYSPDWQEKIQNTFDAGRVAESIKERSLDEGIKYLLKMQ